MVKMDKRKKILGIDVDIINKDEALEVFKELMEKEGFDMIVTPNSEIIENATRDEELALLISEAGLIIPDGIGLVYASKLLGYELEERVTGIDFLTEILAYLEETGKSVYLFGSKPADEERKSVAELAVIPMQDYLELGSAARISLELRVRTTDILNRRTSLK